MTAGDTDDSGTIFPIPNLLVWCAATAASLGNGALISQHKLHHVNTSILFSLMRSGASLLTEQLAKTEDHQTWHSRQSWTIMAIKYGRLSLV